MRLFRGLCDRGSDGRQRDILAMCDRLCACDLSGRGGGRVLGDTLRASETLLRVLTGVRRKVHKCFSRLSGRQDFLKVRRILIGRVGGDSDGGCTVLAAASDFCQCGRTMGRLVRRGLRGARTEGCSFRARLLDRRRGAEGSCHLQEVVRVYRRTASVLCGVSERFSTVRHECGGLVRRGAIFTDHTTTEVHCVVVRNTVRRSRAITLVGLVGRDDGSRRVISGLSSGLGFSRPCGIVARGDLCREQRGRGRGFAPRTMAPRGSRRRGVARFILRPLCARGRVESFQGGGRRGKGFAIAGSAMGSVRSLRGLFVM